MLATLSQNASLMYLSLSLVCLEHLQVVSFEDTFKTSSKPAQFSAATAVSTDCLIAADLLRSLKPRQQAQ